MQMEESVKVSELKEILRTVPDDVDIEFELQTKVPEERLKTMSYPWPYDYEKLQFAGYDCGYSSMVLKIDVAREASHES